MALRLIIFLSSIIVILSASVRRPGDDTFNYTFVEHSEGSATIQVANDEFYPKFEIDSKGSQRMIKSENANVQVAVKFVNTLPNPIKLFWINYQGKKEFYTTLQPGSNVDQTTYETHPWIFEDADTGERYGINNNIVFRATAKIDPITKELERETYHITKINHDAFIV